MIGRAVFAEGEVEDSVAELDDHQEGARVGVRGDEPLLDERLAHAVGEDAHALAYPADDGW